MRLMRKAEARSKSNLAKMMSLRQSAGEQLNYRGGGVDNDALEARHKPRVMSRGLCAYITVQLRGKQS